MWRWIIIVIVVLVAAAAVTLSLTNAETVETATVSRSSITSFVEERARTRLPRAWSVTMPLAGRVLPIDVVEGDTVEAGEVIARLEIADLDTMLAVADARVRRLSASIVENNDDRLERSALEGLNSVIASVDRAVEASAAQTESSQAREAYFVRDLERKAEAFEGAAATRVELDQAELAQIESAVDYRTDVLTLRALEAIRDAVGIGPLQVRQMIEMKNLKEAIFVQELAEARAAHEQAERDRRRSEIVSPVDGVVLRRAVSSERVLPAGHELLQIGRLEDLEIEVEVLSEDAVAISPGDTVLVTGAAIGDVPCRGSVLRVEPQGFTKISSLGVEQQRVRVIVAFDPGALDALDAAGRRLGADFRVRCRIVTETRDDVLIIPRSGLFRGSGNRWQVFAVRGGRARLADVEVGLLNDAEVEIVAGLEAGEPVVLAPETDLGDGARVPVRE